MAYLSHTRHMQRLMGRNSDRAFVGKEGSVGKEPRWWRLPKPQRSWRVFRGDQVEVIGGSDKGRRGEIVRVHRARNRLIVKGARMRRRHDPEAAAYVVDEAWLHVSKVALICPVRDRPTRVVWRYLEDGQRVRVSKLSGAVVPTPAPPARPPPKTNPAHDTAPAAAINITYVPPAYYRPRSFQDVLNEAMARAGHAAPSSSSAAR